MRLTGQSDTSPNAARVHAELLRRAGPLGRLRAGLALSRDAIALSREGLRRSRPGSTERDVLLEWVAIHYGSELAAKVSRRLGRAP